jgi:hypothetical protein
MADLKMIIKGDIHLYCFLLVIALTLAMSVPGMAENRIGFGVGRAGSSQPVDTLYVGGHYEFQISIENDVILGAASVGLQFWSDNDNFLAWAAQPDGYGHTANCITVVPESRLDPAPGTGSFDMTGFLVTEQNIDELGRDTLMFGGVALQVGLQTGPLEHMVSYHFQPTASGGQWVPGYIGTLCMDTCYVPPCGGSNIFVDMTGNAFMALIGDPLCLPVVLLCGNPNGDNDVNVGDAVFMINHVFRGGPAPVPWQLGDANCDGTLDVGDVVFLIAASFRYGPQPECPVVEPVLFGPSPYDEPADDNDLLESVICDSIWFPDQ